MSTRLLIVDDDERIRSSLRLALEDEGYVVAEAASGEEALERMAADPADVVILDLMLPGIDGFECCRRLRRSSDAPVLVISARGDTVDVVAGLEAGADDYVIKPFAIPELGARLRALRRRARGPENSDNDGVMHFRDLEIRPDEGVALRRGEQLGLTKTELKLLCELARAPRRVLSRENLLQRVWDYDYFGDERLVDAHMRRLRTKLEDDPSNPQYVVTVRGLGYKFVP